MKKSKKNATILVSKEYKNVPIVKPLIDLLGDILRDKGFNVSIVTELEQTLETDVLIVINFPGNTGLENQLLKLFLAPKYTPLIIGHKPESNAIFDTCEHIEDTTLMSKEVLYKLATKPVKKPVATIIVHRLYEKYKTAKTILAFAVSVFKKRGYKVQVMHNIAPTLKTDVLVVINKPLHNTWSLQYKRMLIQPRHAPLFIGARPKFNDLIGYVEILEDTTHMGEDSIYNLAITPFRKPGG